MRVQGWDPVLIICQIISLQTIHYLTLSTLIPPFLSTLTSPSLLSYSGGPSTVAHILDWRELAARPTVSKSSFPGVEGWKKLRGAWAGGKEIGSVKIGDGEVGSGMEAVGREADEDPWDYGVDAKRGWVIGGVSLLTFAIDIAPLCLIVRRPTHILDFSLTLIFNHFILTTYYSSSFPTSFFFWFVQAIGAVIMVVSAEYLCVKREMRSELDIGWTPNLEQGTALLDDPPRVPDAGSSSRGVEEYEMKDRT
ncbi:hypothetical protein CI109_100866 [Kwoniella shandongensis]|uniref:Uncharacterized protein n=1 Tax=Kwoniella shandongensis TaxID=1734106 RepID=A0A5M6BVH1_9TREE|nr:uncharacterized protein CI109_006118 [Kwoniella shandongensis]KAA5525545.1 hypothetical protein CI109_006118 [Kwoniella shandongensis]